VSSRQAAYLVLRGGAALAFVLAATVLPKGVPAALVIIGAGVVAVLSCIGVNAGGPGEVSGASEQERWLYGLRAPQGDWPPYDWPPDPATVVEGEVVRPKATPTPPPAS
jgi:hypothetical protein